MSTIHSIEEIKARIIEIQNKAQINTPDNSFLEILEQYTKDLAVNPALKQTLNINNTSPYNQFTTNQICDTTKITMQDFNNPYKTNQPHPYTNTIINAANKYKVPYQLIRAVIQAESGFNSKALSSAGAQGLMQLMPETAKELGVMNAFDPVQNIDGGTKYLSQLLKKYDGNIPLALAAYNAGPSKVNEYGGIPPYDETQNYVEKVLGFVDEN